MLTMPLLLLLLHCRSASPHHGFAAYYTFLEKIFKADAVLHFGTHGSLEFMPGKQVRPLPRGGRELGLVSGTGAPAAVWHRSSSDVTRCASCLLTLAVCITRLIRKTIIELLSSWQPERLPIQQH
jgi:hypothetical protein